MQYTTLLIKNINIWYVYFEENVYGESRHFFVLRKNLL